MTIGGDEAKWTKYGCAAYLAYGEFVGWRAVSGDPMPPWDQLPERIRGAWCAAARAAGEELAAEVIRVVEGATS